MMMRSARAVPALALAAGLPTALPAQRGLNELGRNMKMLDKNFDAADRNHDGMLTRQEAQAAPFFARHFDAIDAENRGEVSKQDVHAYVARPLKSTSRKNTPTSAGSASHP
ncbi:MAG TPA: EF-hand domain-containing protein [Dyella sp.]|uniref:EF-hand domain-containing protein n=1 Tax=Dyella sp. TaxID=1869338 RepID=UPI002CB8AE1D|nr:EF-hand domain-containing protein [Dyella sp.]HUB89287.1 EF-hand domain-containing protein [Dyella sp.]